MHIEQKQMVDHTLDEKWLLIGTLLSNIGNSMIWPVSTLYMTGQLHQSFMTAGLVLMIGSMISVFGSFIGGQLFDHWQPYKALLVTIAIIFLAVASLIFWNGWPMFAILIWVANFGMGIELTLVNAYATTIRSEKTRVVFNNLYIVLNVGMVLGTLVVGYLFDYGFYLLMIISSFIYLLLWLVVFFKFNVSVDIPTVPVVRTDRHTNLTPKKLQLTPLLIAIGALLFITYLSYILWETVMAPHMKTLGMPTRNYADLWMINGITIILFQRVISNWANKHRYEVSILIGSVIFASSFFFLIFVQDFWQIVIVFELLTVGEMLQSPQVPAWVAQMTPQSVAGQAQGFVTMMISSGRVVGPLYSGFMMDRGWMRALFLSVFIMMILISGGLFMMTFKQNKKHT